MYNIEMNIKYKYPVSKICVICHQEFFAVNRYQAQRNKLCFNPNCKREFISRLHKGKKISLEQRKILSRKLKGRIFTSAHIKSLQKANKDNKANAGKKFPLEWRKRLSESAISRTHYTYQDTSIERRIEKSLKEMGLKYKKQYVIAKITKTDFYIPSSKLVIMCDGDYWHNLPGRKEQDKVKTKAMEKRGFRVLRLTEREINDNIEKCKEKICQI